MGVAYGEFFPSSEFSQFEGISQPLDNVSRKWDANCETLIGEMLTTQGGGIVIIEYDLGDGEKYFEVSCLGISNPPYTKLFPHHVKAYDESF